MGMSRVDLRRGPKLTPDLSEVMGRLAAKTPRCGALNSPASPRSGVHIDVSPCSGRAACPSGRLTAALLASRASPQRPQTCSSILYECRTCPRHAGHASAVPAAKLHASLRGPRLHLDSSWPHISDLRPAPLPPPLRLRALDFERFRRPVRTTVWRARHVLG